MHSWTSVHYKKSDTMQSVLQDRAKWNWKGDFVRVNLHLLPGLDPADATAKVDGLRSEKACIVLCVLFSS